MRKIAASAIIVLALNLFCVPSAWTQQPSNNEDLHVRKIKKYVAHIKRWTPGDPIKAKLRNGTKVKGYIAEIADDYFVVTDREGRQPVSVNFSEVKDISSGFGTKSKIALAIGGAVLVMALIFGRSD